MRRGGRLTLRFSYADAALQLRCASATLRFGYADAGEDGMDGQVNEVRADLAARLLGAENGRSPIEPLTDEYPNLSVDDAYQIQARIIDAKLAAGGVQIGWKAGFTSRAMQKQMGVNEPNYGCLLDSAVVKAELSMGELIHPRVEPEIAFVMDMDLSGPGVTAEQVLAATRWVCPCIEVVDSRIKDYRFQAVDNIADNSSAARLVMGATMYKPDDFDLRLVGVVLEKDGEVVETGAGAAALGDPALSVAWIANQLTSAGKVLREGQIVITGGLTAAPYVRQGDEVVARFDRLGPVQLQVV